MALSLFASSKDMFYSSTFLILVVWSLPSPGVRSSIRWSRFFSFLL
jgi:hypothetical protein